MAAKGGKPCSCCSQRDPSQGAPASAGLLGRAMHSQGAVWWQGDLCQAIGVSERSWEALSCQPVLPTPSARAGLLAQCPQRGRVAQGEQTSCACMSRHLCSWTCLTGRGCFLFLHDNLKRGFVTKQGVGLEWMSLRLCRMLFLFTGAGNFARHAR